MHAPKPGGDVIRLYWLPSNDTWHAQNLSAMIRAN